MSRANQWVKSPSIGYITASFDNLPQVGRIGFCSNRGKGAEVGKQNIIYFLYGEYRGGWMGAGGAEYTLTLKSHHCYHQQYGRHKCKTREPTPRV